METSSITPEAREAVTGLKKLWWLWLLIGIAWVIIGLVILQFDQASVTTVGIIIGIMFVAAGLQNFVYASFVESHRWLWAIFGVLFIAAGIVAFISPENTFTAIADILGFLFLLVGVFWAIEAMAIREVNDLWWIGLIGGFLMIILAFWTAGQFFIEKAYLLLVFAGIWSLMQGVIMIVRAFQIKNIDDYI